MYENGYFKREEIPISEYGRFNALCKHFKYTDVFKSCYTYTYTSNEAKILYGDFYLDFDGDLEKDFNILKQDVLRVCTLIKETFSLKNKHIRVFFSGSKGFHILIHPYN